MNTFMMFTVVVSILTASVFADDSFGGVGVVYKLTKSGIDVQDVIPDSPIAETKIKAGDVIVAIDGTSIQGKKSSEVKNALRGLENKPVVLTYVSEGDTLIETVRRVNLTVKTLNSIADTEQLGKELLAVLNGGKVIADTGMRVSDDLKGVYVDRPLISTAENELTQSKEGKVKLVSFSRSVIRVNLETAGAFVVSIVDSNGDVVRQFTKKHGKAGINSISWDSSLVPDGRYAISVVHNGAVCGANILLK